MEHKAAHLNTLARRRIRRRARVDERRVRDAARAAIRLAVEALDQEDLLRRQSTLVVPALARGVADGEGLALAVGVDEADGHELVLADAAGVGDGEGVPLDAADGPPHVDDLHAALEELGGLLGGQVVRHARERGRVRLVDVHALHGAAEGGRGRRGGGVALVLGLAADRVVEDDDLGGAGAGGVGGGLAKGGKS